MPTRVEEICRKIHILFAKGEAYQNSPDLVILSKGEMFTLLEQLNEAMYEVLDQYEATSRSKEKARIEMEREASEIIGNAKKGAEDVQAASLAYTDTLLDEISVLIESTTQSIRDRYLEFLSAMEEKQNSLKENRDQLGNRLTELHDSENYLELLNEIREEQALRREEALVEEEDSAETDTLNNKEKTASKRDEQGSSGKVPVRETKKPVKDRQNNTEAVSEDEFPPLPKAPEPVIRVNRPGENPGVTFTTKRSHNKKRKTAPPSRPKVQTMSEEELSALSPEERESLESSTPAYGYGYTADDFNLDAEYEQFKQEQAANNSTDKKGGFKLFGKKKK